MVNRLCKHRINQGAFGSKIRENCYGIYIRREWASTALDPSGPAAVQFLLERLKNGSLQQVISSRNIARLHPMACDTHEGGVPPTTCH
jgi:hypothetical protein